MFILSQMSNLYNETSVEHTYFEHYFEMRSPVDILKKFRNTRRKTPALEPQFQYISKPELATLNKYQNRHR